MLDGLTRPDGVASHEGLAERAEALVAAHDLLVERADALAEVARTSLGTPPFETHTAEILTLLESFRHAAKISREVLSPTTAKARVAPTKRIVIERVPHGVVALLTPFNFPLAIAGTEIAHAFLAGNAIAWKPSEHAFALSRAFLDVLRDAGIGPRTLRLVEGGPEEGRALLEAPIDYASFTGSTTTGRSIAATLAARGVPARVEVGGKADAIVCDDADLERTALALAYGAFFHAGQVCVGVQRAYVARACVEPLVARLTRELDESVFSSQRAPLVLPNGPAHLARFVEDAVAKGARVVGDPTRGAVVVVSDREDLLARREECFGPLLLIAPIDDDGEALRAARAAPGDLILSVFSEDATRSSAIAARAPASVVMLNDVVWSYGIPELPFAGARKSGFPATHGVEGLLGYTRPRVVVGERLRPLAREPVWFPYTDARLALVKRATTVVYGGVSAVSAHAKARVKSLLGRD